MVRDFQRSKIVKFWSFFATRLPTILSKCFYVIFWWNKRWRRQRTDVRKVIVQRPVEDPAGRVRVRRYWRRRYVGVVRIDVWVCIGTRDIFPVNKMLRLGTLPLMFVEPTNKKLQWNLINSRLPTYYLLPVKPVQIKSKLKINLIYHFNKYLRAHENTLRNRKQSTYYNLASILNRSTQFDYL